MRARFLVTAVCMLALACVALVYVDRTGSPRPDSAELSDRLPRAVSSRLSGIRAAAVSSPSGTGGGNTAADGAAGGANDDDGDGDDDGDDMVEPPEPEEVSVEDILAASRKVDAHRIRAPTEEEVDTARATDQPLYAWGEVVAVDLMKLRDTMGPGTLKLKEGKESLLAATAGGSGKVVPAMITCVRRGELTLYNIRMSGMARPSDTLMVTEAVIAGHVPHKFPAEETALGELQRNIKQHTGTRAQTMRAKGRTLCCTFVGDSGAQRDTVLANMVHAGEACDWAILSYNDQIKSWKTTRQRVEQQLGTRLSVVLFADAGLGSSSAFVPKPTLYRRLTELIDVSGYGYIWLLDADIAFTEVSVTRVVSTLRHVFKQPLLLGQPAVAPGTQFSVYLNADYWLGTRAIAVETSYVEQQAPLIDARFFQWFVDSVLQIDQAAEAGSDWGYDGSWCLAARAYAGAVLGLAAKSRPVCAVLPSAVVQHADAHAIKKSKAYREAGVRMAEQYEVLFPHWTSADRCKKSNCGSPETFLSCKPDRRFESHCGRQKLCPRPTLPATPWDMKRHISPPPAQAELRSRRRSSSGGARRRRSRR